MPTAKLEALKVKCRVIARVCHQLRSFSLQTRYLTHVTSLHPERLAQTQGCRQESSGTTTQPRLHLDAQARSKCALKMLRRADILTHHLVVPKRCVSPPFVGTASERETVRKVISEDTVSKSSVTNISAESTGAGIAPPLMKAESTGAGIAPPLMKAESTGAGIAPPLMKAESTGAGKAPPVMKAESTGAGIAPPVMKAESTGAGIAPPLMKAESTGAGIAPPVMKAESTGAGIAPPLMKAESTGAGKAPPVMKAESTGAGKAPPVMKKEGDSSVNIRPLLDTAEGGDVDVRPPLLKAHLPVIIPEIGSDHLLCSEAAVGDDSLPTSASPRDPEVDNNDNTNIEDSKKVEDSNGEENLLEDSGNLEESNGEENLLEDSGNLEESNGEENLLEDRGNLEENLLEDSGNLEDSNGGGLLLGDSDVGGMFAAQGVKTNVPFQEQHGGVKCQLVDIASEGDQPSEDYQNQSSDFQIHTEDDPALHIVPALNQVQGSPSVDHHDSSSPTVDTVLSQLRTANNQLSQGSLFYTDKDLQAIGSRLLSQLKTFASTVCGMLPESIPRFGVTTHKHKHITHTSAHTHTHT